MANIGDLTVSVSLDVPDKDAFVCAKLLEIYLNRHPDKSLIVETVETGETLIYFISIPTET